MLRERKLDDGRYVVTATSDAGKIVTRTFSPTRQDEESHARFVDENRDMTNRKPFRSKALRAKAKESAYIGKDGAWHSDIGAA